MSGVIMETEDYISLKDQQIAAQEEQIDKLLAMLRDRDREIAVKIEQVNRMTLALDDALGIVRSYRAREEAARAEAQALEL